YRQHVPGFLPLAALREEKTGRRAVWVFIAAQGGAQVSLYRELREDAILAAKPGLRVIPLFGAGFPQSQEIMGALADIYAGLDIPVAISK
ncbi:MAG: hypothetical protein LBU06_07945, partial [Desulfovibrio sp.]|nr:hypothetical protein [Desulfovibrio sp.]